MKRKTASLIVAFLMAISAFAQGQLKLRSFEISRDITAQRTQYKRLDANNHPCALIKVCLPVEGCTFRGNVIGDTPYSEGEYWVYVESNTKRLNIRCPGMEPSEIVWETQEGSNNGVQSGLTYILKLDGYEEVAQIVAMTMYVSPDNATVLIDAKTRDYANGKLVAHLPLGDHEYIVSANGYKSAEGVIRLKKGGSNTVRIELEKEDTSADVSNAANMSEKTPDQLWEEGKSATEQGDFQTAFNLFETAAKQGHVGAQVAIGGFYEFGMTVERDYEEAIKWFTLAAEQGDAFAQLQLAHMYFKGRGVTKNFTEAAKWYAKAAEQGEAEAQRILGLCYMTGNGVALNHSQAFKYFKEAAEQGDAEAQYYVGVCYENGNGVSKSILQAISWYKKAAEQGNADAKQRLQTINFAD